MILLRLKEAWPTILYTIFAISHVKCEYNAPSCWTTNIQHPYIHHQEYGLPRELQVTSRQTFAPTTKYSMTHTPMYETALLTSKEDNIICLAGYSDEIFKVINEIRGQSKRNNVLVVFYLLYNGTYYYIGTLLSEMDIVMDKVKNNIHCFIINKKYRKEFCKFNNCWLIDNLVTIPSARCNIKEENKLIYGPSDDQLTIDHIDAETQHFFIDNDNNIPNVGDSVEEYIQKLIHDINYDDAIENNYVFNESYVEINPKYNELQNYHGFSIPSDKTYAFSPININLYVSKNKLNQPENLNSYVNNENQTPIEANRIDKNNYFIDNNINPIQKYNIQTELPTKVIVQNDNLSKRKLLDSTYIESSSVVNKDNIQKKYNELINKYEGNNTQWPNTYIFNIDNNYIINIVDKAIFDGDSMSYNIDGLSPNSEADLEINKHDIMQSPDIKEHSQDPTTEYINLYSNLSPNNNINDIIAKDIRGKSYLKNIPYTTHGLKKSQNNRQIKLPMVLDNQNFLDINHIVLPEYLTVLPSVSTTDLSNASNMPYIDSLATQYNLEDISNNENPNKPDESSNFLIPFQQYYTPETICNINPYYNMKGPQNNLEIIVSHSTPYNPEEKKSVNSDKNKMKFQKYDNYLKPDSTNYNILKSQYIKSVAPIPVGNPKFIKKVSESKDINTDLNTNRNIKTTDAVIDKSIKNIICDFDNLNNIMIKNRPIPEVRDSYQIPTSQTNIQTSIDTESMPNFFFKEVNNNNEIEIPGTNYMFDGTSLENRLITNYFTPEVNKYLSEVLHANLIDNPFTDVSEPYVLTHQPTINQKLPPVNFSARNYYTENQNNVKIKDNSNKKSQQNIFWVPHIMPTEKVFKFLDPNYKDYNEFSTQNVNQFKTCEKPSEFGLNKQEFSMFSNSNLRDIPILNDKKTIYVYPYSEPTTKTIKDTYENKILDSMKVQNILTSNNYDDNFKNVLPNINRIPTHHYNSFNQAASHLPIELQPIFSSNVKPSKLFKTIQDIYYNKSFKIPANKKIKNILAKASPNTTQIFYPKININYNKVIEDVNIKNPIKPNYYLKPFSPIYFNALAQTPPSRNPIIPNTEPIPTSNANINDPMPRRNLLFNHKNIYAVPDTWTYKNDYTFGTYSPNLQSESLVTSLGNSKEKEILSLNIPYKYNNRQVTGSMGETTSCNDFYTNINQKYTDMTPKAANAQIIPWLKQKVINYSDMYPSIELDQNATPHKFENRICTNNYYIEPIKPNPLFFEHDVPYLALYKQNLETDKQDKDNTNIYECYATTHNSNGPKNNTNANNYLEVSTTEYPRATIPIESYIGDNKKTTKLSHIHSSNKYDWITDPLELKLSPALPEEYSRKSSKASYSPYSFTAFPMQYLTAIPEETTNDSHKVYYSYTPNVIPNIPVSCKQYPALEAKYIQIKESKKFNTGLPYVFGNDQKATKEWDVNATPESNYRQEDVRNNPYDQQYYSKVNVIAEKSNHFPQSKIIDRKYHNQNTITRTNARFDNDILLDYPIIIDTHPRIYKANIWPFNTMPIVNNTLQIQNKLDKAYINSTPKTDSSQIYRKTLYSYPELVSPQILANSIHLTETSQPPIEISVSSTDTLPGPISNIANNNISDNDDCFQIPSILAPQPNQPVTRTGFSLSKSGTNPKPIIYSQASIFNAAKATKTPDTASYIVPCRPYKSSIPFASLATLYSPALSHASISNVAFSTNVGDTSYETPSILPPKTFVAIPTLYSTGLYASAPNQTVSKPITDTKAYFLNTDNMFANSYTISSGLLKPSTSSILDNTDLYSLPSRGAITNPTTISQASILNTPTFNKTPINLPLDPFVSLPFLYSKELYYSPSSQTNLTPITYLQATNSNITEVPHVSYIFPSKSLKSAMSIEPNVDVIGLYSSPLRELNLKPFAQLQAPTSSVFEAIPTNTLDKSYKIPSNVPSQSSIGIPPLYSTGEYSIPSSQIKANPISTSQASLSLNSYASNTPAYFLNKIPIISPSKPSVASTTYTPAGSYCFLSQKILNRTPTAKASILNTVAYTDPQFCLKPLIPISPYFNSPGMYTLPPKTISKSIHSQDSISKEAFSHFSCKTPMQCPLPVSYSSGFYYQPLTKSVLNPTNTPINKKIPLEQSFGLPMSNNLYIPSHQPSSNYFTSSRASILNPPYTRNLLPPLISPFSPKSSPFGINSNPKIGVQGPVFNTLPSQKIINSHPWTQSQSLNTLDSFKSVINNLHLSTLGQVKASQIVTNGLKLSNALKTNVNDFLKSYDEFQSNIFKDIPLGDIAIAKYVPINENEFIVKTDDPSIELKAWYSKMKVLQAKLIMTSTDYAVVNFMPVVKNHVKYNLDNIEHIAKSVIKQYYGEPIVIKGVYSNSQPYAVVENISNAYGHKCYILWPTYCKCGCGKCGCMCQGNR